MEAGILTLDDFDFRGRTVILRVDINSPLDAKTGAIANDNRIRKSAPTIRELADAGARVVILAHQGDIEDYHNVVSLAPHAVRLAEVLGRPVGFVEDNAGPAAVELPTRRTEAYDAYLLGNTLNRYESRDAAAIARAVQAYADTVARDPQFAAAWAALASTHAVMAFHREGDAEAHRSEAHRAASRCLGLDETIPEAHVALATLAYSLERDWPRAEREFRRALALNPSYAYAHRAFAVGLLSRGRFDEALAELDLAAQLDPIADAANNERATTLYCAGRYEEAIAAAQRVLEKKPDFYYARVVIGNVHTMRGNWGEAEAEYANVLEAAGRNGYLLSLIGFQCARQGRREDALRLLEEVRRGGDAPLELARIYAGLGEKAIAIAELERAAAAFLEPFGAFHDHPPDTVAAVVDEPAVGPVAVRAEHAGPPAGGAPGPVQVSRHEETRKALEIDFLDGVRVGLDAQELPKRNYGPG